MNRIDLSGQWLRSVGGSDLDYVTVPGSFPPMGECLLTREFASDWPLDTKERCFLCTEGVLAKAEFTVNGTAVGTAGPWATYRFELPAGVLRKQNTLTARIRDICEDFGPMPGRRFDAGLVRPIWLERRPQTFLDGFCFTANVADDLASAQCTVSVTLDGPSAAPVQIELAETTTGRVIARSSATVTTPARFTVDRPMLWSPETPNLYTLTVVLPGDQPQSEKVGFRKLESRQRDFYLNNQRLLLKGICRHEFTHASGYSPSEAEIRRELGLIRHAGFNYIRLVHSPHSPRVCRIAAELGILVSEEPGTCFHDLSNPAIYAPAFESLRRTVLRDRNVPSIFAWLIYNECEPNNDYAVMAAKVCRQLNPGCLLGMADCTGKNDAIKSMVAAADLSFYGINIYNYYAKEFVTRMAALNDKPLVITEWGGCIGQGNPRVLQTLCDCFVLYSQSHRTQRVAGGSFWIWADYEERNRPLPATVKGFTIEGLVDRDGRPKPDLQQLSMMCFDMGRETAVATPKVEILAERPRRPESWHPINLSKIDGDQAALQQVIDDHRKSQCVYNPWDLPLEPSLPQMPRFGKLIVDGIEMHCRDVDGPAWPLLLGKSRSKAVIPINARVCAIAVLGQVAMLGGYPSSTVFSVHHRDAEAASIAGQPAAQYELLFADGSLVQPLRHGVEILRHDDLCRWWSLRPRGPVTRPAVRCVIDETHEILRLDLWELRFDSPRQLQSIRWRLLDDSAILATYALSVEIV